jgi:hypothetical protein
MAGPEKDTTKSQPSFLACLAWLGWFDETDTDTLVGCLRGKWKYNQQFNDRYGVMLGSRGSCSHVLGRAAIYCPSFTEKAHCILYKSQRGINQLCS